MNNYACTTQVPNRLFDELLPELSFAELKILLAVNRATWGWVVDKTGRRKERAWLTCSRLQTITGLSKRAITNAIAALMRRRLLSVTDTHGTELDDPQARRGQLRLYFSLRYPQLVDQTEKRSANTAYEDQQRMLIIETKRLKNQERMGFAQAERRPRSDCFIAPGLPYSGRMEALLKNAVAPVLWERLNLENGKRPV